jgi:hypothetical protein
MEKKNIFKKIAGYVNQRFGTGAYGVVFALATIIFTVTAGMLGGLHLPGVIGLFAAITNHVALFILILFTFQYFQGGVDLNITKKIFEEGNVAAAIYQGAIVIAFAIIISGAIM